MTGLDWALGGVLAVWFLTSLAQNLGRRPWLRLDDPVGLVPNWRLFSRPRVADVVLLRRDITVSGAVTPWREVEVAGQRRWHDFIWNPGLSPRRAFLALGSSIITQSRRLSQEATVPSQGSPASLRLIMSVPYLSVLRLLSETSDSEVAATQFMIVSVFNQAITGKYAEPGQARVDFVSEVHAVHLPETFSQ